MLSIRSMVAAGVGASLLLAAGTIATAAPFSNGNFEAGTTGWTFTPGPGAVGISTTQGRTDGAQAVAWNSGNSGPGAMISQTFDTVPGQRYNLQFDIGGLGTPLRTLSLDVDLTGISPLFSGSASSLSAGSGNRTTWDRYNFPFVADSASTTLTFTDTTSLGNSSSADGNLDQVSVTAVNPVVSPGGAGNLGTVNFLSGNLAVDPDQNTGTPNPSGLTPVASQSTTRVGGGGNVASVAIDNITNGSFFGQNSVTHTAGGDPDQWWRVDLGVLPGQPNAPNHTYAIDQVVLFNRSDCCQDRLVDFDVNILNTQTGVDDLNTFDLGTPNGGNSNSWGVSDNGANAAQSHGRQATGVFFAPNTIGETVFIDQNPNITLSLAEVQAFGLPDYDQSPGEVLQIDIAGPGSHDFVYVQGDAVLDETLGLSLLGGYSPAPGTTFDVLTAASITLGPDFQIDQSSFLASTVPGGNGELLRLEATAAAVIPEPSTLAVWSLLAALGLGLAWRRRSR